MTILYIISLIGSFIMGYYDNKDMTVFVMLLLFGSIYVADKLSEKRKRKQVKRNVL